eukprot:3307439-Rhodomonas_salina.1
MYNNATAWKFWAFGILGLPFLHRFYLKGWCDGWWFLLRVATWNYLWLGWVLDGVRGMSRLNRAASKLEKRRQKLRFKRSKEK